MEHLVKIRLCAAAIIFIFISGMGASMEIDYQKKNVLYEIEWRLPAFTFVLGVALMAIAVWS